MAKTVDKLFEKYLNKFETEFLRSINTNDEEAIHDLRVAIKKIRALFLFFKEAGYADIKSDYPYLNKLKDVFKKAGKLREYQIHKNLLNEYQQRLERKFPGLDRYMNEKEKEAQQAYHEFMPGITFRKLYQSADELHKSIGEISPKNLNKKLYTFIKSRVDECHGFMYEPHYETHLHQIRKYLKHIRFIIGQNIGNVHELCEPDVNFKDTKKVEDILGEWHDRDEFRKLLEEYHHQLPEKQQQESYEHFNSFKLAVDNDIQDDIKKLRPELVHLFSLIKTLLDKKS